MPNEESKKDYPFVRGSSGSDPVSVCFAPEIFNSVQKVNGLYFADGTRYKIERIKQNGGREYWKFTEIKATES